MSGPATVSTVYTPADKGGTTVSCDEAWQHISTALSDPALFDDYSRQVCTRTGFDVTQPDQLNRCRSQLGEMGDMMMGTPLSLQAFMTNILLGNSVGDVLFEDSPARSEEHTSELQSLMRISYAVFCLKKKKRQKIIHIKYTYKTTTT